MQRLVTGIHHVSIVVTDLELSRRFYTQVLGLREIPRPATFDFVVVWYDLGAQHIHLVPRETAGSAQPPPFRAAGRRCGGRPGAFCEGRRADARDDAHPRCDRFFVGDPDGNLIEIMQWFRLYRPETDGIGSTAATFRSTETRQA